MTVVCTSREPSGYEAGRLAPGDARLFRPGGLELTDRAISLANLAAGARVVDLGCGAGDTVRYLRLLGLDAVGIDPTARPAETQFTPTRILARAEELPLADDSVHAIFAECSVSLFDDRDRALAECARVLNEGGRLIISDLYARRPEAIEEVRGLQVSCIAGILVREELEASLAKAGFTIEVWEDHSRALRECAARYLFEHGSLDGLWGCSGGKSSQDTQAAMRAARAGYFLLIATRRALSGGNRDRTHER
jgi:ubiquinone/menaquinone biosynthesis C-methylase UbiE